MNIAELLRVVREMYDETEALMGELSQRQFDAKDTGIRLDGLKNRLDSLLRLEWEWTIEKELSDARHRLKHRRGSRATSKSFSGLYDCHASLWHIWDYLERCEQKSARLQA